jgi:hypothetical protein
VTHEPAFSPRVAPEALRSFTLKNSEGAGKAGCRLHPWAPCNKKHGGGTTGVTGNNPAFPARMVLRLTSCSPRRRIPLATVASGLRLTGPGWAGFASARLAPATGARTTRLRRPQSAPFVDRAANDAHEALHEGPPCKVLSRADAIASTASRPTFVTIAIRPSGGGTADLYG